MLSYSGTDQKPGGESKRTGGGPETVGDWIRGKLSDLDESLRAWFRRKGSEFGKKYTAFMRGSATLDELDGDREDQAGDVVGDAAVGGYEGGKFVAEEVATNKVAGTIAKGVLRVAARGVAEARPFAMGLTDEGLEAFAQARGATTWKQLPDPANWRAGVLEKLADPKTRVHFNLDGVDVWPGVSRAAAGRGGPTDWELLTIQQNPQFWKSIQFWKGGAPAPNPFQ